MRAFTPGHAEALGALAAAGFSFALEEVTDLDMDFAGLKEMGFAFVELDAPVFLDGLPAASGRVPASDICRHLSDFGLTLIVGRIEDDWLLARILGFGVLFGKGTLFGGAAPRQGRGRRRAGCGLIELLRPWSRGADAARLFSFAASQSTAFVPIMRNVVLMRRTVPVLERSTTVSVSANSPRKCTPSSSEPSVTPVAEKITSPEAISFMEYLRRMSVMPMAAARVSSSFFSGCSRPCIWPPMQRSAAAASTPSGAPPMPK